MTPATLEKVSHDIEEIKVQLNKISHILEEDFELNDQTKKDLAEARKESLSEYVDHEDVMKEFF